MAVDPPADSSQAPGGAGGGADKPHAAPFRQMELARGIREQRLERRVLKAKARLARETAKDAGRDAREGLDRLRAMASQSAEVGDRREARLSTEAILHHHREVVKMLDPDTAAGVVNDNRKQVAVIAGSELLGLLGVPETRAAIVEGFAAFMDGKPSPSKPETNWHAGNGSDNGHA